MATFPSYAKILLDGFGEQRESALLRTEMESGPQKQVKIKSRVMVTRPVQIILPSKADYNSFITWYRDTINEGANWFDWLDPVSSSTKSVRFNGSGIDASPLALLNGHWVIRGLKLEGWGI